jgi:hypothetical protein
MKESKYLVRDYKTGDEEGITSLFKEVFGKDMSIKQWRWKYLSINDELYTKVAQDAAGRIIAHAGAIYLRGTLEGRAIPFFQIADVMVHPDYRGYMGKKNLFNCLMKALFEGIGNKFDEVFCYGFPGKRPYLVGKRSGVYESIEEAVECILESGKSRINIFKIVQIDWKDKRLENLWNGISKNLRLSLIRDTRYLQWRYASNPFFSYHLLGIFSFGRLKGWIVTKEEGDDVFIIDLLIEEQHLRHLIKAIKSYFAYKNKTSIRLWLPENWRRDINDYKEKKTGVIVTNMIWQLPLMTGFVRKKLYYTMGDVDIF